VRVLLVGAGAIGTLLGWALAAAGDEVLVEGRRRYDPSRADLTVLDPTGRRRTASVRRVLKSADPPGPADLLAPPDLIILAVKAFDLPVALDRVAGWREAPLLTIQNGIGAEEAARAARPDGPLLGGSVTASVERAPDGSVRWLTRGGIGLAVVQGSALALRDELVAHFNASGLRAATYPDWAAMKWSKLLANLTANASSAILDTDPAAIYGNARLFALERAQLREALAVMDRLGLRPVGLPGAPVPWLARATALPTWLARPILARVVGGGRGGKMPSLRLHLASGVAGPSEIGQLNGAVMAAGRRLGLPTPANAALTAAFEDVAHDPARRAWYREDPRRIRTVGSEAV
jgi:2-dehydropantoate 2-reductase